MYCKHCGGKIDGDSRFCNLCGKELGTKTEEKANNKSSNHNNSRNIKLPKFSNRTVRIGLLCIAITIVIVVVLILVLPTITNGDDGNTGGSTRETSWEEKVTAIQGTEYETILKSYLYCVENDNTTVLLTLYHDDQVDLMELIYEVYYEGEQATDSAMIESWEGLYESGYYQNKKNIELETYNVLGKKDYVEGSFEQYETIEDSWGYYQGDMDHTVSLMNTFLTETMGIHFDNVVKIYFECQFKNDYQKYWYVMNLVEIDGEWYLYDVRTF